MNKLSIILLIISFKNRNKFIGQESLSIKEINLKDNQIQSNKNHSTIKLEMLIHFYYLNPINYTQIDAADQYRPLVMIFGFFSIFFLSVIIAFFGLLWEKNLNFFSSTKIEYQKQLKITMILGFIMLLLGLIYFFMKFKSYAFNGNNIALKKNFKEFYGTRILFKKTIIMNIVLLIFSIIFVSLYFYFFIFNLFSKNNLIYNIYISFYISLPVFVILITIFFSIYISFTKKNKKNIYINPMINRLYIKFLNVASVIFLLFVAMVIYYRLCALDIFHKSNYSGFISGSIYLIIILIALKKKNMKIKDNIIPLLFFFISYGLLETFFILKIQERIQFNDHNSNSLNSYLRKLISGFISLEVIYIIFTIQILINSNKNKNFLINKHQRLNNY